MLVINTKVGGTIRAVSPLRSGALKELENKIMIDDYPVRDVISGTWLKDIGMVCIPKNASTTVSAWISRENRHYTEPLPEGKRLFCILRDPVERFESGYSWLTTYRKDVKLLKINQFVRDLHWMINEANNIKYHLFPQIYFTGHDPARFERIFHINKLDECHAWLESQLHLNKPMDHRNKGEYEPQLTEKSKAYLRDVFACDYKFMEKVF